MTRNNNRKLNIRIYEDNTINSISHLRDNGQR